jgi:hypothetical protein
MKTSAGILSYEIYNQEGKNELSASTQENYTQLLKLKLRNSSPYHKILFKKAKTPHLTLKFKKGVLPESFKSDHVKVRKYRLIKGSDLFSQAALEGYLFDKTKMENEENFEVDVQKILDSIDANQAIRSVVTESLPFGIDSLLKHFQQLKPEEKTTTYKWIGQLEKIQTDYKTALSDIRKLTLSNDVIKANPLFTNIIQEVATVFEKLTELQQNSVQIEQSLESLAQQVRAQQKADIQSLEANFQNNYKKSTQHLLTALKTNLKTIIVEALAGHKIGDITNLSQLTINEDIIKSLEGKVFTEGNVQSSDWITDITKSGEEDSITFTCKKEMELAPNEYLLMDFELIGALRGTARSVVTELDYGQLEFQKDGIEDISIKDKLSQSVLNLVNEGAFGIPPELELVVAEGKNILNNGQYENTIQFNLINKGSDNIMLSEVSKLRLSFYNQQENETVAYALQGKDDAIDSVGLLPQNFDDFANVALFKLIKNQDSLTSTEISSLLGELDTNELLSYIDLSDVIHPKMNREIAQRFKEFDKAVDRIYKMLDARKPKAFRLSDNYIAIYDDFESSSNNFIRAYILELEYKKGDSNFQYKIYYKDNFRYNYEAGAFIDKLSDAVYLGRIKVLIEYNGHEFMFKLGFLEIIKPGELSDFSDRIERRQFNCDKDLKIFLKENRDLIKSSFNINDSKLNLINNKFEDFDAVFYNKYMVETKANRNKTIQYIEVVAVKKISSNIIEVYEPFPKSVNDSIRDLETIEVTGEGFDIVNHLNKTPIVPESMELIGAFYLGEQLNLFMPPEGFIASGIANDLILSLLPNYGVFLKNNELIDIPYLSKLSSNSTIQTTYENEKTLPTTLAPNESLMLMLNNVKTQLPEGEATLKISLLNVPNYKDAHLSAVVNRVSYLNSAKKGIFTTGLSNNNLQIIQDTVEIKANNYKIMPVGSIMMWYGETDKIPGGWKVCDGSSGTPDLRDRFVVGAGKTYKKGDTGGKKEVSLSLNQMPSHNHEVTDGDYYLKNWKTGTKSSGPVSPEKMFFATPPYDYTSQKFTKYVGGGAAHENRPPYYALYYIMRTDNEE